MEPAPKGLTIRPADQSVREQWARSQTLPHRQVQRARILLALAHPKSLVQVSGEVGVSEKTVIAWQNRYTAEGLEGLADRPRRGCLPTYTQADRDAMCGYPHQKDVGIHDVRHVPPWPTPDSFGYDGFAPAFRA